MTILPFPPSPPHALITETLRATSFKTNPMKQSISLKRSAFTVLAVLAIIAILAVIIAVSWSLHTSAPSSAVVHPQPSPATVLNDQPTHSPLAASNDRLELSISANVNILLTDSNGLQTGLSGASGTSWNQLVQDIPYSSDVTDSSVGAPGTTFVNISQSASGSYNLMVSGSGTYNLTADYIHGGAIQELSDEGTVTDNHPNRYVLRLVPSGTSSVDRIP
jgi:hypothetical protein